jgi:hypothetical protein
LLIKLEYHEAVARRIVEERPDIAALIEERVAAGRTSEVFPRTAYRGLRMTPFDPEYDGGMPGKLGEIWVSLTKNSALSYMGRWGHGRLAELQIPGCLLHSQPDRRDFYLLVPEVKSLATFLVDVTDL